MVNVRPGEGVFENNDFQKKKRFMINKKKKKCQCHVILIFSNVLNRDC